MAHDRDDDWNETSGVARLADHEARLSRVESDVAALTEAVGVLERAEAAGVEWRKTVSTREQVAEVHSDVRALRTAWAAQVRPPSPPATNGSPSDEAQAERAVGRVVLRNWKVILAVLGWLVGIGGGGAMLMEHLRPPAPSAARSSASAPSSPP